MKCDRNSMKRLRNDKGLFYLVKGKGEMKILQSREKRERERKKNNDSEREREKQRGDKLNILMRSCVKSYEISEQK